MISEMKKTKVGHRVRFGENMPRKNTLNLTGKNRASLANKATMPVSPKNIANRSLK